MIGYDVESFLFFNGRPVAAEDFIGGTKHSPEIIDDNVVAHPDNVAAEFASRDPFCPKNLSTVLRRDLSRVMARVSPASISFLASMECPSSMLQNSVFAAEIGCDPDFLLDNMRDPISVNDLGNYRFAGGHIHFDCHEELPNKFAVKVCDVLLGAPLVAMGEKQGARRSVYGIGGLYRPKPYGIEYRTLSNFWAKLLSCEDSDNSRRFQGLVEATATVLSNCDEDLIMRIVKSHDYAVEIINRELDTNGKKFLHSIEREFNCG